MPNLKLKPLVPLDLDLIDSLTDEDIHIFNKSIEVYRTHNSSLDEMFNLGLGDVNFNLDVSGSSSNSLMSIYFRSKTINVKPRIIKKQTDEFHRNSIYYGIGFYPSFDNVMDALIVYSTLHELSHLYSINTPLGSKIKNLFSDTNIPTIFYPVLEPTAALVSKLYFQSHNKELFSSNNVIKKFFKNFNFPTKIMKSNYDYLSQGYSSKSLSGLETAHDYLLERILAVNYDLLVPHFDNSSSLDSLINS